MQRKTSFIEGAFYHIYNRGVDKRVIFPSTADYKRFMTLLYLSNTQENVHSENILRKTPIENVLNAERGRPLVAIGAFCLMPNHFHLLITPVSKDGISRFMLKLQTGYSMYFNIKNDRTGSLFEGPFKAIHAGEDRYLKYLFSYIHLNPAALKNKRWKERVSTTDDTLRFVEEYPYSSLRAYLSGEHAITNPEPFPRYFSTQKELKTHLTDWLAYEQGLPLLR